MAAAPAITGQQVLPANVAQADIALRNDSGPIGVWLRNYVEENKCTTDEALTALRVAKPTLRTYQLTFRSVVRFWFFQAQVEWPEDWDGDDKWSDMVQYVKDNFMPQTDDAVS
jgi:hypothetical protein